MISSAVIEKFIKLTNYPMDKFLVETESFFKSDLPTIVNFFKGYSNTLDKKKIENLNKLTENAIIITNLFHQKKGVMKTVDFWELLNRIEDIKSKLKYSQNISKYLRSSIVSKANKAGFAFDYTLSNQQTLESVTDGILEEGDYDNSWANQALDNDLKEQDWDINGGKNLILRKQIFQSNLVTTMIDNTIGERIYGRDIKKLLEYKDDDLLVLGYKETVYQTADILSKLTKGDIPEFKSIGLDLELYKGNNFSQLNYPSITRELQRNFATDDLFKDFEIKNIRYEEGEIFVEYQVDTKYELVIIENVSL